MNKFVEKIAQGKWYDENYLMGYSGVELKSSDIKTRELYLAIPSKNNPTQWEQIQRAIDYAKSRDINLKITEIEK